MTMDEQTLLEQLRKNPPKLVGGYKKQGWAIKVLERIANPDVEDEGDGLVTAKAVLWAQDGTYYPAFLTIDLNQQGRVVGVYFIAENKEQFDLIPFEWAKEFLGKPEQAIIPFRYRTLSKIDGDQQQTNWPDFR
ncbi:hypothetical protein NSQ51_15080 [Geobacillus sp. FSL K6-0789]|uniref:Uncharacterized protein n=1 Tax=Geobacillus stearothermophilus TaxID=1422 RepID=A0A150MMJ0_GEOSE|nr:hypothetical protein [Geobacillus stearothermophilus]KAF6509682.1 hypothetical protein GS8_3213 [Geobacillus stearothermophilus]KMY61102.1 hypothetical protein AA906_04620 [Geobacillus stearothermophilus]KOR95842.1 hypothetical protein N231_00490 [Geobacillus stearothermophilus ATCC 12980]KYD25572.1 hypothetical protein B4109_2687 [Geobacillus stearothermophilus]MED3664159.1 hypothetical protein [Geobacillus stearothermophilus]